MRLCEHIANIINSMFYHGGEMMKNLVFMVKAILYALSDISIGLCLSEGKRINKPKKSKLMK